MRRMGSRLKHRVKRSRLDPRLEVPSVELLEVVEVPDLRAEMMARAEVGAEEEVEVEVSSLMEKKNQGQLRLASTVVAPIILPEIALLQRRKLREERDLKLQRERRNQEPMPLRLAISATRKVTSPRSALKMLLMSATTATSQVTSLRNAHPRLQENQGSQENLESQESQEQSMMPRSQKSLRSRKERPKRWSLVNPSTIS